ncbi:corticotropin-releasing factor receptor 2 isoform X3 [Mesocricetus auratus]|uniref:Corticotropin-releasing factor receptor 2 n=1 Tax=Mesocricetus auratus TaxID=10036 RepID=A0A1U8CDK9_MESAU|nr:corticotropin-releasing factor receptor 2 isoform X3 [Mesocricetus auratus]
MDAALFHSLLEANCSLALAEELILDGWGVPTDAEGTYSYCNTTLDQIGTCWPQSTPGALVERPCPEYFNGIKYNTTRNAYRECLENGTWASRINYSHCEPILDDKQRKYDLHYRIALIVNYLGHCVSMVALVAAFLLFLVLRSIRCLRNVIHWNLISTFILRNVAWFLLQLIDHEVHEDNEVWCRCITTIFNYFVVTNFFWMFVEGCYLHTAVVLTYSTEHLRKWLFLFIGWCIPCPIIIAWAVGKLYYENEQCWFGKEPGDLVDYIYQGPIILVLLINFIFLFNIVRILMTKLRASTTSETIQYRKAVKATLVLLPLLGITYILFFVNPGEDDLSQIVFIYFNSFLQSFQGFFVSVFYCFFNGEVGGRPLGWSRGSGSLKLPSLSEELHHQPCSAPCDGRGVERLLSFRQMELLLQNQCRSTTQARNSMSSPRACPLSQGARCPDSRACGGHTERVTERSFQENVIQAVPY